MHNPTEIVNFNKCTLAFMEDRVGLVPIMSEEMQPLQDWLNADVALTDFEIGIIQFFSKQLNVNVLHWKEFDLSLHFIGPMFSLVNFTEKGKFNLFAQESFEAQVLEDLILQGRVDEVVASGFRKPKLPLFAINEYKKHTDPDGDPSGQCLAAMHVGQLLNNYRLPMYGCVVIGRNWHFMYLQGNEYAISHDFDATVFSEACQIIRILKQLKAYCITTQI
jgi:hypothetical protein